jgi:hypothetical protein
VVDTVRALTNIPDGTFAGTDEKGDFVECSSVKVQADDNMTAVKKGTEGIDWSHLGQDLKTVSTPKGKPEGF